MDEEIFGRTTVKISGIIVAGISGVAPSKISSATIGSISEGTFGRIFGGTPYGVLREIYGVTSGDISSETATDRQRKSGRSF